MKFSELDAESWPELQPFLDTCLLPVTGLTGTEAPWEMADLAASAGEWLVPFEKTLKGRTVTLPAFHYYDGSEEAAYKLRGLCSRLREIGFRHVVLISGQPGLLGPGLGADLIVQPGQAGEKPDPETLLAAMKEQWNKGDAAGSKAHGAPAQGKGLNE